jgi:FkbM family methyltransferase
MRARLVLGKGQPCREPGAIERAAQRGGSALGPGAVRIGLSRVLEAGLWIATAGRGLRSVLPRGEIVRLAPRNRRTFWNIEEYEAFRAASRTGDVVIDAGAHTGAYTVLFAQWVGPQGHVYAFEPVPVVASALRAQLALNRVSDRVTVVEAALGDRAGRLAMTAPGTVGINRRAVPTDPPTHRLDVTVMRLDDFCAERRISPGLLKFPGRSARARGSAAATCLHGVSSLALARIRVDRGGSRKGTLGPRSASRAAARRRRRLAR